MPILDVELIGPVSEAVRRGLAARIADAAAAVLGSPPQGTWVKLRFLDADAYAENAGGPPPEVRPVFVRVLQAEVPQGPELAELTSRLTTAVAAACDRGAENVHVLHELPAAGRIAFGGRLRE